MRASTDPFGLLGRRVALRYRIGTRDGRPLLTDAVGELRAAGDALLVLTRQGPVRVDPDAVVAVREVPPTPPRRPSWTTVAALQELCADVWPAQAEQRLGGWRLRAAGGFTGRANAAVVTGAPDRPVAEALAELHGFAARHDIGPRVLVPAGSPWERPVLEQGWTVDPAGLDSAVRVGPLDRLSDVDDGRSVVLDEPLPAWWGLVLGGEPDAAQRHVLTAAATVGYGLSTVDAEGVGAVRLAVLGDYLHVARLTVRPGRRRAGVGRSLMAAAARWGAGYGARWCVLQMAVGNESATAFYDRLGLPVHHHYRYLVPA